ncbi:hypothetical protein Scep_013781 [Stephania cephalantha]|uniref:Leucine-rich repeat-containing N-terminal plant-type domain-containing protein n=1 Tax=Stephania cephalantha TaxID=152367 RepID=A0AAP0J1C3_9MAGN
MASHAFSLALTLALTALVLPLLASANSDADALDALHHSLIDPDNVLQSWDPTLVNPCSWFHITCNQDNRVTRVELFENNIQGTIPSELGNLKNLRSLDLFRNSISGSIPPTLGNLKSLLFLRLNDNQLTGRVPSEIASLPNLKVLTHVGYADENNVSSGSEQCSKSCIVL